MKWKCFILVKFLIILNLFCSLKLHCQELIHEGFDSGKVAKPGWVIKATDVYKSASASGAAVPSIQLGASGNYIETCQFSNATECSFFIKGYSVDSISALAIYYKAGDLWFKLDSLTHLPTAKKVMVLPLPDSAQKLRFVYHKSSGNLAFDDLIVRNTHLAIDSTPPVFKNGSPKVISLSDTSALFSVSINKPGLVHFIIAPENCAAPENEELLNFNLYNSACLIDSGTINFINNTDTLVLINGLKPGSEYQSYWLASSVSLDTALTGASEMSKLSVPKINYDLFFSEIIKGSGNNKAIEIFNPSADTVSLNNYRITLSTNGGGWKTSYFGFPAGAVIKPLDVFVILKANADTSIVDFSVADDSTNSSVLGFTGNDARGIQKFDIYTKLWKFIDKFGYPDSSANFDVAGISAAASNHTLIRKPNVKFGNTDWAKSAGTNIENSEWIVSGLNDFSDLGKHNMFQDTMLFFDAIYFECQEQPAVIDTENHKIIFELHSESDLANLLLKFSIANDINIDPNPSLTSDYTLPVKFVLTNFNHTLSTEWTLSTCIDEAPVISEVKYDENDNYSITIKFNEPITIKNSYPTSEVPLIKIFENGKPSNFVAFEKLFDSENKVIKLVPDDILKPGTIYTLSIDSVSDLFQNKMPAYEWTFKTEVKNEIRNNIFYSELKLWPNPASGMLNVKLPANFNKSNLIIELVSADGKIIMPVMEEKFPEIHIYLLNVKSGLYILNVKNNITVLSNSVYVK
jgi:Lamin Tail Domain/Secretion system C-terminal sorting domain/Bacterial Ig-like domain